MSCPELEEEAWSSGGVLTDGSSELQLRNLRRRLRALTYQEMVL